MELIVDVHPALPGTSSQQEPAVCGRFLQAALAREAVREKAKRFPRDMGQTHNKHCRGRTGR